MADKKEETYIVIKAKDEASAALKKVADALTALDKKVSALDKKSTESARAGVSQAAKAAASMNKRKTDAAVTAVRERVAARKAAEAVAREEKNIEKSRMLAAKVAERADKQSAKSSMRSQVNAERQANREAAAAEKAYADSIKLMRDKAAASVRADERAKVASDESIARAAKARERMAAEAARASRQAEQLVERENRTRQQQNRQYWREQEKIARAADAAKTKQTKDAARIAASSVREEKANANEHYAIQRDLSRSAERASKAFERSNTAAARDAQRTATINARASVKATEMAMAQEKNAKATQAAERALNAANEPLRKHATFLERAAAHAAGYAAASMMLNAAESVVRGLGHAIFGFNATLEEASVAFTVMSGSAELASEHLLELQKFARETPFKFTDLIEGSRRLQAYGFTLKEVIPWMDKLGNIASGVGKEKLPQLILALGQTKQATRLTGNETRQWTEAGIDIIGELARAYGKTEREMRAFISEGVIGFDSVRYVLTKLTSEGGRFDGIMQKLSRTFNGAMNNIGDSAEQLIGGAFKSLFDAVSNLLVAFADFLQTDQAKEWSQGVSKALTVVVDAMRTFVQSELPRLELGFKRVFVAMAGYATEFALTIEATMANMADVGGRSADVLREMQKQQSGVDIYGPTPKTPQQIALDRFRENFKAALEKIDREFSLRGYRPRMGMGGEENEPYVAPGETGAGGGEPSGGPPPLLDPLDKKGKKEDAPASGALVDRMVREELAYRLWLEDMQKLVADGDIFAVGEAFGVIGSTAEDATKEVLKMLDAIDKLRSDRVDALAKELMSAQEKFGSPLDLTNAGIASFQKNQWIKSMEADIAKVSKEIERLLAEGLDPSDVVNGALTLFDEYGKAIRSLKTDMEGLKGIFMEIEEVQRKERWMRFSQGPIDIERGRVAGAGDRRVTNVIFQQPVYGVPDLKTVILQSVKEATYSGGYRGLMASPGSKT